MPVDEPLDVYNRLFGQGLVGQQDQPAAPELPPAAGSPQFLPQPEQPAPAAQAAPDELKAIVDTQALANKNAPKPPTPAQAKQQAAVDRSNLLLTDPTMFASGGGVVKNREELARMQGGEAQRGMEAYQAQDLATKEKAQLQAFKDKRLAGFVEETANQYMDRANVIDSAARARIAGRQKQVDEMAKMHVDPSRAWHGGSGAVKGVMYVFGLLAASQTKNATGNMQMLINAADNMVNRDITAQKADIANKGTTLNEQDKLDAESGKLDLKGMADWSAQRELRYQALGKMLDAQIAQMGTPAADRAGLLKAKMAVDSKIVEEQGTFQKQVQTEAESSKAQAHTAYMARLNHQFKMEEQDHEAALKRQEEQVKQLAGQGALSLTTSNHTGLVATDKAGNPLKDANGNGITIRARDAASATKAGEQISDANELNSQYAIILDELSHTSNKDLAEQNFTPRMQAAATQASRKLALLYNKGALTDRDVQSAGKIVAGAEPLGGEQGMVGSFMSVLKTKGDTVKGAREVLKAHIASLANNTVQHVTPYLNAEDATNYKIAFQPQNTEVEPAKGEETTNERIARAGGGADVSDIQTPTNRRPLDKKGADSLISQSGDTEGGKAVTESYVQQRDAGHLPHLPAKEQDVVDAARDDFQNSTPAAIIQMAQAYRKQIETKHLSDETRFQITMEARLAVEDALNKQNLAIGRTLSPDTQTHIGQEPITHIDEKMKQYENDITGLMQTDAYKTMRKRVGLERDVGE